jgi:hypothetical protein
MFSATDTTFTTSDLVASLIENSVQTLFLAGRESEWCKGVSADNSNDLFWKRFNENVVLNPDNRQLVNISNLKEGELMELFEKNWAKAKRFRTRHDLKHGYLLNCATILKRLYVLNLHKWGRDEGQSAENLETSNSA